MKETQDAKGQEQEWSKNWIKGHCRCCPVHHSCCSSRLRLPPSSLTQNEEEWNERRREQESRSEGARQRERERESHRRRGEQSSAMAIVQGSADDRSDNDMREILSLKGHYSFHCLSSPPLFRPQACNTLPLSPLLSYSHSLLSSPLVPWPLPHFSDQ